MRFEDKAKKWWRDQEIGSSKGNDLQQILARFVADNDATEWILTAKDHYTSTHPNLVESLLEDRRGYYNYSLDELFQWIDGQGYDELEVEELNQFIE